MRETKQSHRQNVGKRWSEDQAAKNSGRYGKNGQVIRKRCSKRPSRWVTMFKTVSVAETVKTWKDVERGRSRPDVVKSTRRAPDTEDTVEKPVFWAKTWAETRKRRTGAKSAGRREKYPTGARHGGYGGKTSFLGENVGRNAKTWNRGEVGRTSRKVPDGRPTRRIRWKNQFSGRKRGPKHENVEPGRSRPDVVKSTRRAPDTEDTVGKPVFWRKRGPKRENVERGRSRSDVVKSTRRAPNTEDRRPTRRIWWKNQFSGRKRGTGAKSAGRREKYPTGARHGGYGGKTSFLGENVGRNAKTWNRGEVGRTS